jgi:pyruvyl transferase EpsO
VTAYSLDDLRDIARESLTQALDGHNKVGLVNFPNHGNPGDPAIWMGSKRLLKDLGVRVRYESAWWNFDPKRARAALGNAPVLINGGGNFGDLYLGQHETRLRVLATMRHNPVVQLPQSMFFKHPAQQERAATAIAEHGGVTLMAREQLTVQRMRDAFGVEPLHSPDHALGNPSRSRTTEPTTDLVWIIRKETDPEFNPVAAPPANAGIVPFEWMDGIFADQATWDAAGLRALRANTWLRARQGLAERQWRPVSWTFDPLAKRWVDYGFSVLSSARVVVTDKLHGHILAALAGIPHVVLDNSYGKVSGTLDAWTQNLPGVYRAANGQEAYRIAQELLGRTS